MSYLIGIDVGTTGTKTILINERGETIARAFSEFPLHSPYPNWAEQDPGDWWKATLETLRKVISDSGVDSGDIKGIGLSGQMHSAVFLDRHYNVLRPAILWCDTRTTKQCQWITEKVSLENLVKYVSNPALEGFTAPKIIWLRDNEPETYKKVHKVLLPKDYIRFRLTGELAAEVSDAAGTLLFDVRKRRWSEQMLKAIDVPIDFLPDCYESIDVCGRITEEVARMTGLKKGTPVVGGGADNTCGATGTGIVFEGRVLSSLGTSGVVFAHCDQVKIDPHLRVHTFCHSVPNKWYLMGVMLAAGGSFRWFRDTFGEEEKRLEGLTGIDAYELLSKEAAGVPVGSEGLIFLPYLMGERTPHKDAFAKGVFFGITNRHDKRHFVRAVLEGITFGMRDSLEIMRELGVRIEQIRVTGGGGRSPLWRQIQADVYGTEVVTTNATEGPAFGAAIMAGVGAGIFGSIEEATESIIKIVERTEPIAENLEKYEEYYNIYKSLYPKLKDSFRELWEITIS